MLQRLGPLLRTTRLPFAFPVALALAPTRLVPLRNYARLGPATPKSYAIRSRKGTLAQEDEPIQSTHFDQQQQHIQQQQPLEAQITHSIILPAETETDVIKQDGKGPSYVLQHAGLMVGRQLEMMNVLVGYEQANKYSVTDHNGVPVGFICEEEQSFMGTILRQVMGTRRAFKAVVLDVQGNVVLKIDRPIKWFLNSSITISDANDTVIGEVKQAWHPIKRKYDLFLGQKQFGIIETPFLSWDFHIEDENGGLLSAVNRSFGGFAREIFTDTGVYAIHLDTLPPSRPVSLDERAVILACAIDIDIDYFSRHSNSGGGLMPFLMLGAFSS
ncbi:hypothetical protein HDU79_000465 [Rhizoclosmatium sp. JEL0117]|nr:hypothetical protein HDU79_000465 [Rhizoclosmatium sp. JEL0117]